MKGETMKAGNELDKRVALEVMNYWCDQEGNLLPPGVGGTPWQRLASSGAPSYSTDFYAALDVAEKMQADGFLVEISWDSHGCDVLFLRGDECGNIEGEPSFPLAICLSALQAVGERVKS
jgi:hypothetical protein